ncbi:hypothetical protein D3C75_1114050 [compost metagenome]
MHWASLCRSPTSNSGKSAGVSRFRYSPLPSAAAAYLLRSSCNRLRKPNGAFCALRRPACSSVRIRMSSTMPIMSWAA